MATAARSHRTVTRVQFIEATLPSLEKSVLAQTSHIHFAYTAGMLLILVIGALYNNANAYCSMLDIYFEVILGFLLSFSFYHVGHYLMFTWGSEATVDPRLVLWLFGLVVILIGIE